KFNVYTLDTNFNSVSAIYFVTRRYESSSGYYNHKKIYVGETGNLPERFDDHHKKDCFKKYNANCICVYQENSEERRLEIEKDLYNNYKPVCNNKT
ncbi:MAG: GIY-YIG nuclease family protein, partial [bacterium]